MARFVVLHHRLASSTGREDHFDLMLESAGRLLTWSIEEWPVRRPVSALQLAPHRLEYLHYEGPISNDRGEVSRVDEGLYQLAGPQQPSDGRSPFEFQLESREGSDWYRLEPKANGASDADWTLRPKCASEIRGRKF